MDGMYVYLMPTRLNHSLLSLKAQDAYSPTPKLAKKNCWKYYVKLGELKHFYCFVFGFYLYLHFKLVTVHCRPFYTSLTYTGTQ